MAEHDGGSGGGDRSWAELIPDALGLIFRLLSLKEVLTVVPQVCRSWRRTASGPYCWQEIDVAEWSQCSGGGSSERLARMVRLLVSRGGTAIRRLSVSGLPDDALFSFILEHAGALTTLELPRGEVTDAAVERLAPRLSRLTYLDVSYCPNLSARALEAVGRHCPVLKTLRRVMHPLDMAGKELCQDDEALAIARTMPGLRHLEMSYAALTTAGVLEIIARCPTLGFLDVRGCWDVNLDREALRQRHAGLVVLGPQVIDCYDRGCLDYGEGSASDEEFSDGSVYSWEFMDDEDYSYAGDGGSDDDESMWDDVMGLEGLELRFFGAGGGYYSGFEWPPSP